jgi:hypothetical protein
MLRGHVPSIKLRIYFENIARFAPHPHLRTILGQAMDKERDSTCDVA